MRGLVSGRAEPPVRGRPATIGVRDLAEMTSISPPRQAAALVLAVLCAVYFSTAAPTLTFWDASEFATAIGSFGIPHPPGTPLYVALGTASWRILPLLTPVQVGTLLSAVSTACACAIAASLIVRATGARAAGVVAGLCAGLMGTVWLNATETEVYAVALLSVALQFEAAWRAHRTNDDRARVLVVYLAALSIPLHLSALVATPAALLLALTNADGSVRWRTLVPSACLMAASVALSRGGVAAAAACLGVVVIWSLMIPTSDRQPDSWLLRGALLTLVGWSAVMILLVRARHAPYLNQGDPDTLSRLLAVVSRAQYEVAPLWPRRAPFWIQLGNVAQYADWQVALTLWNDVTPAWRRTPFTLGAALLGITGAVAHWRSHRATARVMLLLLGLASLGVAAQLNLRAGPSFGIGVLPIAAVHEARERDYFFALAFWCWGLWIGVGCWALLRRRRASVALIFAVPVLMLFGNFQALNRNRMPDRVLPTMIATELLQSVPPRGMLFTAGDNDSYPLWYRQTVDSVRQDVQIVVMPLLPANWYFRERAFAASRMPADTLVAPTAIGRAARLARHQLDMRVPVAVSIAVPSADRMELGRLAGINCWRRIGMIDLGSRAELCPPRIDAERTFASAQRLSLLRGTTPRRTPDGMITAFLELARCPDVAFRSAVQGTIQLSRAERTLLDITCNLR